MYKYSNSQTLPPGIYDRFEEGTTLWNFILFDPSRPLQSAELNEIQSLLLYYQKLFGDTLYSDGTILAGTVTSTFDVDHYNVAFTDAQIWAYGFVNVIPAGGCEIDGVGAETVSLVITPTVISEVEEPTLSGPVIGSEAYTKPGAKRWVFSYSYVPNTGLGIIVANFVDGQLVPAGNTGIITEILALMALQKYEEDGSFVTTRPDLVFTDEAALATNPINIQLAITNGVGYQPGFRLNNTGNTIDVQLQRPMTGVLVSGETHAYHSGTKVYLLSETPVHDISTITVHRNSGAIVMTKGPLDGADEIPEGFQPVYSIVSVVKGVTTYTQGVDYSLVGNDIQWIHLGAQPNEGDSYTATVTYIVPLTKAIRTLTNVVAESKVISGATTTLNHADASVVTNLVRVSDSVVFVQGVDFTLVTNTGVINWINSPGDTNTVHIDYQYWAHTTEGDFLGRDSFRDGSSNVLYFRTPGITPTGIGVNYKTQIALDTTSGILPVDSTDMSITYHFTGARRDVLLWNNNGTFSIDYGTPDEVPVAPTYDSRGYNPNFVPVAYLNVPAEAVAADVTYDWYGNRTLTVEELNNLYNQVQDLEISSGLAEIEEDLTEINNILDTLTSEIASLTSQVATLNSEFAALVLVSSYQGTTDPNVNQTGKVGDFYLWKPANLLYECITAGIAGVAVWVLVSSSQDRSVDKSSSFTVSPGGFLYLCDTTSAGWTQALPIASTMQATGVSFKNIGTTAKTLVIAPATGERIEFLAANATVLLLPGDTLNLGSRSGYGYYIR